MILEICVFRTHNTIMPDGRLTYRLRAMQSDPSDRIVYRASEPSLSNRWGAAPAKVFAHSNPNNSPGQTSRLNNGTSANP